MGSRDVVGLTGGLGNQLFQYAFGLWLESRSGRSVDWDLSAYRTRPEYFSMQDLGLDLRHVRVTTFLPHAQGRFSSAGSLARRLLGPRRVWIDPRNDAVPSTEEIDTPGWWYGYWQNTSIVDEVINRVEADIAGALGKASEPVTRLALHVRRGDMVGKTSALPRGYYREALEIASTTGAFRAGDRVSVFTDDEEWCRAELGIVDAVYPEASSPAADFLRLAKHETIILSGSTFSWWAAHVRRRDESTVIAPNPFTPLGGVLTRPGWCTINRGEPR